MKEKKVKLPKRLQPYKVVVQTPPKEEKTEAGIYLPNQAGEEPFSGKLMMIGDISESDISYDSYMKWKLGEEVVFRKGDGVVLEMLDERLRVIDIRSLLYAV